MLGRRPRRVCIGSLILGFQRACLLRDQDDKRARWGTEPLDVSQRWAIFRISPARSPIMTQGAMVLPVVMRGMMEPSAIRRLSMPWTLREPSTTDIASCPILAVHV